MNPFQDDDFSTHFQLHHDTPSKFFGPASPWALSLSPSVFFGRVNTPSMSTESNPFEVSFHPSTKSKPVLDDWDIDRTPGPTSLPRRKRAMSSPAVPPGASGFNLSFDASVDISSTFKRPRMSLPDANATDSSNSPSSAADSFLRNVVESGAGGESDTSPDSSSVFTPPESTLLPPTTYNFEKSSTSDPIESLSLSDFFDQGISYQSVLSSALPPLDPTTRHTSYEQFVFPPTVSTVPASTIDGSGVRRSVDHVSPFIFHLERERNLLQLNGPGYGQQLPPPPPVDFHPSPHAQIRSPVAANAPAAASPPATRAAAKGKKDAAKGKKGKRGKKGEVEEEEEEQEGEEGEDEEARRKMFLERNRIAACKSRQKKKERVGNLESQASDLGAKNHALQSVALALRDEVLQLRQLLALHDGCSCEHVAGYLARESTGGGIPTIDALAGQSLSLDYTNVPTMGSEDDLYGSVDSWLRADEREGSVVSDRSLAREPTFVEPELEPFKAGIDIPVGAAIPLKVRPTKAS